MEDIRSTLSNPENREVTLGMIIEKLDQWEIKFGKYITENDAKLEDAFKRLDQQEQYLFVFKISKCAFGWLDKNGIVKWGLVLAAFWAIDWFNRVIFWDLHGVT